MACVLSVEDEPVIGGDPEKRLETTEHDLCFITHRSSYAAFLRSNHTQ